MTGTVSRHSSVMSHDQAQTEYVGAEFRRKPADFAPSAHNLHIPFGPGHDRQTVVNSDKALIHKNGLPL